jgi:hypothetical protein
MIDPMTSRLAQVQHQERLQTAAEARQHRAMSVAADTLIARLRQVIGKQLMGLNQRMRASVVLAKVYR